MTSDELRRLLEQASDSKLRAAIAMSRTILAGRLRDRVASGEVIPATSGPLCIASWGPKRARHGCFEEIHNGPHRCLWCGRSEDYTGPCNAPPFREEDFGPGCVAFEEAGAGAAAVDALRPPCP